MPLKIRMMDFSVTSGSMKNKVDKNENDDTISLITENGNNDDHSTTSWHSDNISKQDHHSVGSTEGNHGDASYKVTENFQFMSPIDFKVAQIIQNKSIILLTADTLYIYPEGKTEKELKLKEINDNLIADNDENDIILDDEKNFKNEKNNKHEKKSKIRKYSF